MMNTTTNTGALNGGALNGGALTIKVGVMPGRIQEVAIESGMTIQEVLRIAELDNAGFEVRYNGVTSSVDTKVTTGGTILLVKQIKGNGNWKIGVMPGRITEFALEEGVSLSDALTLAELDRNGYEVRINGTTVTGESTLNGDGTILLVKQIKGNANVKIGVMPGRINEYAVNDGTTVAEALGLAELSNTGYEVRVNGTTVTDMDTPITSDGTILLVKQIKGNK